MDRQRYPREAARTLRQADRARAEAAFERARAALQAAGTALERARAALAEHTACAPRAPGKPGPGSVTDLRREAAYARAHADASRRLRAELRRAEGSVGGCRRELEQARALVVATTGAERVLDRDRARFEEAARKGRDRDAEEEADEVASGRGPS
mgnify:CR=1 FL=1